MNSSYDEISNFLLSFRDNNWEIQIFPHVRVDGDCLGSAAALATALLMLRIKAKIYLAEEIPPNLLFMELSANLFTVCKEPGEKYCAVQGAVVAVDCSADNRMGKAGSIFSAAAEKIIIDHHLIGERVDVVSEDNMNFHAQTGETSRSRIPLCLQMIVPDASSTAELMYHLLRNMEEKTKVQLITEKTANYLMIGIQSDTGRFSHHNTTPSALRTAAALMEAGANVYENSVSLFNNIAISALEMNTKLLADAEYYGNGQIAVAVVPRKILDQYLADESAVDGLADSLRNVKGVLISIVLRETKSNSLRVNIRTNTPVSAAEFAAYFGGGGHKNAAGFAVSNMDIKTLRAALIDYAKKQLKSIDSCSCLS